MTTINETLAAISKLHSDAREIERSLSQHAKNETDPKRHALLHRAHRVVHDFALSMPALGPLHETFYSSHKGGRQ